MTTSATLAFKVKKADIASQLFDQAGGHTRFKAEALEDLQVAVLFSVPDLQGEYGLF